MIRFIPTIHGALISKIHRGDIHGASRAMPADRSNVRERSIRLIIKSERRLIIKSPITIAAIRISSERSKSLVEFIIDRKPSRARAQECADFSLVKLRTHVSISRPHVTSPRQSAARALGLQNNYVNRRPFFFSPPPTAPSGAHQSAPSSTDVVIKTPRISAHQIGESPFGGTRRTIASSSLAHPLALPLPLLECWLS